MFRVFCLSRLFVESEYSGSDVSGEQCSVKFCRSLFFCILNDFVFVFCLYRTLARIYQNELFNV